MHGLEWRLAHKLDAVPRAVPDTRVPPARRRQRTLRVLVDPDKDDEDDVPIPWKYPTAPCRACQTSLTRRTCCPSVRSGDVPRTRVPEDVDVPVREEPGDVRVDDTQRLRVDVSAPGSRASAQYASCSRGARSAAISAPSSRQSTSLTV